jgi:hypothetical protein
VPVSTLLDHLRLTRNHNGIIPPGELAQLERGWLAHKIYVGPDHSGRSLMNSKASAVRAGS